MFCKRCGSKIMEGQKFCSGCGAAVDIDIAVAQPAAEQRTDMGMHCPRCGKTNLQPQSSNRIVSSTTMARTVGRKHAIGGTSYNSIAETYWFCNNCGMKFRDLDELQVIIKRQQRCVMICKIFLLATAVIFLLVGLIVRMAGDTHFIGLKIFTGVYLIIILPLYGIIWLWAANDAKKKEAEYNDLLPKVRRGF